MKNLKDILSEALNYHSMNDIINESLRIGICDEVKVPVYESLRIGICDEVKVPVYESLRIGINDTPDPNIEDINYTDPEIKEFYLVRFMPEEQKIFVDIIKNIRIKLEIDKPDKKVYNISGDFSIIETNKYTNAAFTLDQSTGIIYRYVHAFTEYYDILIHPAYYKGFMEFVKSFINDEHATFYIDEVLDILRIDVTNIPEEIKNVEYTAGTQYFDRVDYTAGTQYFDRIKTFLKI